MIWKARYRAVMGIIFVVAILLGVIFSSANLAWWIIIVQSFVFLILWITDIVMKAFMGKPLFYDVKIL